MRKSSELEVRQKTRLSIVQLKEHATRIPYMNSLPPILETILRMITYSKYILKLGQCGGQIHDN